MPRKLTEEIIDSIEEHTDEMPVFFVEIGTEVIGFLFPLGKELLEH